MFYARLYIDIDGHLIDVDCRPSDAIALAVRAKVPVFIEEDVMEEVGILPEPDISEQAGEAAAEGAKGGEGGEEIGPLDAFTDFLDTLDFDVFEGDESSD